MSPLFVYNPSIMATINVYEQYFEAECCFNGRDRHAALVRLISDSENKSIKYEVAVSFFPHDEPDDFAVSYDAYVSKEVYSAPGRRSKKKETALLETFRQEADQLAASINGKIFWEQPLREARLG